MDDGHAVYLYQILFYEFIKKTDFLRQHLISFSVIITPGLREETRQAYMAYGGNLPMQQIDYVFLTVTVVH